MEANINKEPKQFDTVQAKKISKATFIFGYVFSVITIVAAVLATTYWINDARKNGGLADLLLMLLFFAFIAFIIYIAFAVTYSALLIVKVKKVDPNLIKQAKQLDLAGAIINLTIAAVVIVWMIIGSIYGDSVSDVTYILYSVCFDIAVIITLGTTIFNTIQYKNVFSNKNKNIKQNNEAK